MGYGSGDMSRPSFFEVAAADRLTQSLRPALQHILGTIAQHAPGLASLAQRSDELFYTMCCLLDRHYLQTHGASFAENFYCLKRVKILPNGREAALGPRDQTLAVLCLAGVPYLRSRLEAYYLETKQHMLDMQALGVEEEQTWMTSFRREYLRLYPYLAFAYEGMEYLHMLRYVMGTTNHFSPLTALVNQRVVRFSLADLMKKRVKSLNQGGSHASDLMSSSSQSIMEEKHAPGQSSLESAWEGLGRRNARSVARAPLMALIRRILGMCGRIGGFMADNAKWAVYVGVFLIRFLQWWYSPDNAQRQVRPKAAPPPPPKARRHPKGVRVPSDSRKCPLCYRTRVNAALLPSGFVFCYTCIFNHLKTHGSCPVTRRPCRMEDLRKIYES